MNLENIFCPNGEKFLIVALVLGILLFIMSFVAIIVVTINLRKEEDNMLGRLGLYGMIFSVIIFVIFILGFTEILPGCIIPELFKFSLLLLYPISLLCMTISMRKHKLCFIICFLCIVLYVSLFCLCLWIYKYYLIHSY